MFWVRLNVWDMFAGFSYRGVILRARFMPSRLDKDEAGKKGERGKRGQKFFAGLDVFPSRMQCDRWERGLLFFF